MEVLLSTPEMSAGFSALFPRDLAEKGFWWNTAVQGCTRFLTARTIPEPKVPGQKPVVQALQRWAAWMCRYHSAVLLQFFVHPLLTLRNWEMLGSQGVLQLQHPSKAMVHTWHHQIMQLVTHQHSSCYVVHVFQ